MASINGKSNELFETLSCRIDATRNSSFVKNFGWPFCMNGSSQSRHRRRSAAAFSENSWLRLFVIEHAQPQAGADNPDGEFREYGSIEPFRIRRTIAVSRRRQCSGVAIASAFGTSLGHGVASTLRSAS